LPDIGYPWPTVNAIAERTDRCTMKRACQTPGLSAKLEWGSTSLSASPFPTRPNHAVRAMRPSGRTTSIFVPRAKLGGEVTRAVMTMRAAAAANVGWTAPRVLDRDASLAHPRLRRWTGAASAGCVWP
jgi:hypothetical protein